MASADPFLPMTRAEMERLRWKELDILLVTGDAYVDHPAFGAALLGRWLVAHGFEGNITTIVFDGTKAERLLGWRAKYDFNCWFKEHGK